MKTIAKTHLVQMAKKSENLRFAHTCRVNATMGISGAFWPETSTLFGTYDAAFLGYGCNGSDADGSLVAADPPPYATSKHHRSEIS
eukprot:COSAG02_NODE_7053_length_3207_cov_2.684041_3_plen_86_part_00